MPAYDDETTVALSNALWCALDSEGRQAATELAKLDTATLRALHHAAHELNWRARDLLAERDRVARLARKAARRAGG